MATVQSLIMNNNPIILAAQKFESDQQQQQKIPTCVENNKHVDFVIRPARFDDYRQIVEWSTEDEDWELGNADFDVWSKCYPAESFLCAIDTTTNRLMGFCAGVKHGEDIGFIGMYFVKSEYRGGGVGSALFKAVCGYLDGRNLCMAAALNMVEKYRQRTPFCIVANWRFAVSIGEVDLEDLAEFQGPPIPNVRITCPVPGDESMIRAAVAYDASVAGIVRDAWCRRWLFDHPTGNSLLALEENPEESDPEKRTKCVGFVQMHEIFMGRLRIGPLYAESTQVARRLLYELLSNYPGIEEREIRFAFVASDERMVQISDDLDLELEECDLRMQTRSEVPFDKMRTFCFSDCEVNFV